MYFVNSFILSVLRFVVYSICVPVFVYVTEPTRPHLCLHHIPTNDILRKAQQKFPQTLSVLDSYMRLEYSVGGSLRSAWRMDG